MNPDRLPTDHEQGAAFDVHVRAAGPRRLKQTTRAAIAAAVMFMVGCNNRRRRRIRRARLGQRRRHQLGLGVGLGLGRRRRRAHEVRRGYGPPAASEQRLVGRLLGDVLRGRRDPCQLHIEHRRAVRRRRLHVPDLGQSHAGDEPQRRRRRRARHDQSAHAIEPNADATYTPAVTGQLWNEGAAISLDVEGDEVPAVSGSVLGVALIALQTPALEPVMTIDRGADLAITWTGGSAGKATVILTRLEASGGTSHSVAGDVRFPAGEHEGTVPAAALQAIPSGPGGGFSFFNRDEDIHDVGDWRITFSSLSSNVGTRATFD